jgi:sulfite reductase beta subunit-like hemoprotein
LATEFRALFEKFAKEREGAERFGDFCHRVLTLGSAAPTAEA